MMYDIIVLQKVRFRLSTRVRKQEAGFLKNLHSGERFWKDAFSVAVSPNTFGWEDKPEKTYIR